MAKIMVKDKGRAPTEAELPKMLTWIEGAIPVLRRINAKSRNEDPDKYMGIHVVFGLFNQQFSRRFPGVSPRMTTKALELQQKVALQGVKGGAILYLWEDRPESYTGPAPEADDVQAEIDAALKELAAFDMQDNPDDGSPMDGEEQRA